MTSKGLSDLLIQLELSLLDPAVRSSEERLLALIADDFVEFGVSGAVYNKQQVISALPQENSRTETKVEDMQVRRFSHDAALVTYRVRYNAADGRTIASLRSSLWCERDGRWQLAFHQGTPTS